MDRIEVLANHLGPSNYKSNLLPITFELYKSNLIVVNTYENGCIEIQLTNPRKNIITEDIFKELIMILEYIYKLKSVKLVLLTSKNQYYFGCGVNKGDIASINKLERLIQQFPKPVISFIDGFVSDAGLGVSFLCTFRIVSERAVFSTHQYIESSPQFDTGSLLIWSKLKSQGLYTILTGCELNSADLLKIGVATHFMKSSNFSKAIEELSTNSYIDSIKEISRILKCHSIILKNLNDLSSLHHVKDLIETYYSWNYESVDEIIEKMEKESNNLLNSNEELNWINSNLKNLKAFNRKYLYNTFQAIHFCNRSNKILNFK
ncbi:3-hydroxyisobutyryl-Coenzyme A hydrolase [Tieghemostelium lacteum]|uniref:3-hydroxyisobutyryl-Coenzyme A hydrolase n=1 Tax=Tieghemostelium lacteum TaxID=361077 RepID=A0A151ZDT7_TIELA|nr:3-hydroxyisobutyryl-Coenzyme A hydrolase [Tieghemostelium lacteum]|eukprot:KYQ92070.1 3-hydroxyisobutyryl-Coenzyme A hydrolase [Tieghemostelium lacteum]